MADPTVQTHGYSGYRERKCRCEVCCAAAALLRKKYRKRSDNVWIRLSAEPLIKKLQESDQLFLVNADVLYKWRNTGLDIYNADKWCLKFGWHPVEVFGQAFYVGCFDEENE